MHNNLCGTLPAGGKCKGAVAFGSVLYSDPGQIQNAFFLQDHSSTGLTNGYFYCIFTLFEAGIIMKELKI
jgi:hypothetical protein